MGWSPASPSRAFLLLAILGFLAGLDSPAAGAPARAGAKPGTLTQRPNPPDPTVVMIGLHLINLWQINQVDETVTLDAYLSLRWQDPRLVFDPTRTGATSMRVPAGSLWSPDVEIVNAQGDRSRSHSEFRVDADGVVSFRERFRAMVSSQMDLRAFPFDAQTLQIMVGAFGSDDRSVVFRVDEPRITWDRAIDVDEWEIRGVEARVMSQRLESGDVTHSRFVYSTRIARRPGYYFWKVFLPLLLIVAISCAAFWVDPRDLNIKLQISITSMLSAIAFNFSITSSLPRIAYMSFVEGFVALCYVMIFLAIVGDVTVHRLFRGGREALALAVDRSCRWVFPLGFLVADGALIGRFVFG